MVRDGGGSAPETTRLGRRMVLLPELFPTPEEADPLSWWERRMGKKGYLLFPQNGTGDGSVGFHKRAVSAKPNEQI